MMKPYPENNISGKSKIDRSIIESEDWKKGKTLDYHAADRVINAVWSDNKNSELIKNIGDKEVVFISQPSTTGTNIIADRLSERLALKVGAEHIPGDDLYRPMHEIAIKHLSRFERMLKPKLYENKSDIGHLRQIINDRYIILTEDILTSGGSVAGFIQRLKQDGFSVHSVVALMGDKRLNVDDKSVQKLDTALNDKGIPIQPGQLSEFMTRSEVGNLIMRINSVRTENARDTLTGKIYGLLNQRFIEGLGRDPGSEWYQGAQGKDKGNAGVAERISSWHSFNESTTGSGLIGYQSQANAFKERMNNFSQGTQSDRSLQAPEKDREKDIGKRIELER